MWMCLISLGSAWTEEGVRCPKIPQLTIESINKRLEGPWAWFVKLSPKRRTSKAVPVSAFAAPGASCCHVETGKVDGDEGWDISTHSPQCWNRPHQCLYWVNTAGIFFEQSGPFDSHLNKIQIEGSERTIHSADKKKKRNHRVFSCTHVGKWDGQPLHSLE